MSSSTFCITRKYSVSGVSDECNADLHSDDGVDEKQHDDQQSYVRQRLQPTVTLHCNSYINT